jgi:glycosyltransferase involved in cell wall biosynthesis
MEIVHIIPNLKNGGAENVLVNISLALNKKGINQSIITFNDPKRDFNYSKLVDDIEIIEFKKSQEILLNRFKKNKKAIVICWLYKTFVFYEKLSIKHNLNNKYYWNIRHSDFGPFQIKQKILLALMGLYSNFSKCKIIYCSEKSKITHEKFFFKKKGSTLIPNRLAKPVPKDFKLPKEENFLLFIGRKHSQKNPKFLKKIVESIDTHFPGFKLVILGRGWKKDYFNTNLESLIIYEQKQNVFDYLKFTSCLLYISKFGEGYPNVIAEAMSVGAPIVGFDAGDYIKMTNNYPLAKIAISEKDFFEKLKSTLNSKSAMTQNQKNRISQELDFEKTIEQYLKLI